MNQVAILSTSFGFGPVSKATTTAAAFRKHLPVIETSFFGSGIALEFAAQSGSFSRLTNCDVDKAEALRNIIPAFREFDAVISVLNLDICKRLVNRFRGSF